MSESILIRKAALTDVDKIRALYSETIKAVNSKDYNEEQIRIWSEFGNHRDMWLKKIAGQSFFVAVINDEIVGFSSVTSDGYLDYMFVHKDRQGKGIGAALMNEIEKVAIANGLASFWARVSITARPFFASKGFKITKRYVTKVGDVEFDDCEMTKELSNTESGTQIREIDFGSEDYLKEIDIRNRILRIPLGLDIANDDRSREDIDHHLGAYVNGKLIGVLVLTPVSSTTVKMRQVAVENEYQGKGIGKLLVDHSERFSLKKGFTKIEMHARDVAVPFYEKLGYCKDGEMFTEVTIPHYKLFKHLNENKERTGDRS